jgi:hypothetical protein
MYIVPGLFWLICILAIIASGDRERLSRDNKRLRYYIDELEEKNSELETEKEEFEQNNNKFTDSSYNPYE